MTIEIKLRQDYLNFAWRYSALSLPPSGKYASPRSDQVLRDWPTQSIAGAGISLAPYPLQACLDVQVPLLFRTLCRMLPHPDQLQGVSLISHRFAEGF